jgi:hypothetical protein
MGIFPRESQRKWILLFALGLALYFLGMSVLSFVSGDWALGLLFLVLGLTLIGVESLRIRAWSREKKERR